MKKITYGFLLLTFLGSSFLIQAQNPKRWTLRECLDYAAQENLGLQIAELSLENSDIVMQRSRAARLPNLNGSSGFNSNFGYVVNPFTNEFVAGGNQSFNLGVSSGVTLYNGGQITQTIRQAEIDQRVAQLDLQQAEYDLALNVTLAYLNILRNQELVESAEIQVQSTREQRNRSEKLVDAGVIPRASLLQIESQIATDELALVNARNQLETAYLNLTQLLQLDPSQPFAIQDVEVDVPENDIFETPLDNYYQAGKANMPYIQSADLQVQSAEVGEKIAYANYLPRLSAFGSLGTGWASGRNRSTGETFTVRDTIGQAISLNNEQYQPGSLVIEGSQNVTEAYGFGAQVRDNINASVGISLNVPIYNRYQSTAAVQQAEIFKKQTELQALQQRQRLEQDIQAAYVAARSAYGTYSSTLRQIESLELTFENTEKQFNLGVVNSVDYLIAKNNLARARNDLVQTKYNYIFRAKILDFYQGNPIGF